MRYTVGVGLSSVVGGTQNSEIACHDCTISNYGQPPTTLIYRGAHMTSEIDRKKSRKSNRQNRARNEREGRNNPFINIHLSQQEKEDKNTWCPNRDGIWDWLDVAAEAGYTVSCRWDEYNTCFGAFMRTADEESINYDLVLTGRGGTCAGALRELLFCHNVLLAENWQSVRQLPLDAPGDEDF